MAESVGIGFGTWEFLTPICRYLARPLSPAVQLSHVTPIPVRQRACRQPSSILRRFDLDIDCRPIRASDLVREPEPSRCRSVERVIDRCWNCLFPGQRESIGLCNQQKVGFRAFVRMPLRGNHCCGRFIFDYWDGPGLLSGFTLEKSVSLTNVEKMIGYAPTHF